MGMVAQQCLPALITASKCSGRYPGRRGEQDQVGVGGDDFLEGIESDEVMFRIDFHPAGDRADQLVGRLVQEGGRGAGVALDELGILQLPQGAFEVVLEGVRHGDQLDVGIGGHEVDGGLRAAPAAADQAELQFLQAGAKSGIEYSVPDS